LGVPIYAERGSHGGFRLVDGYRTRLDRHDRRRGGGAVPRACPGPAAELGLGTVVAAAQPQVLARASHRSCAPGRPVSSSGFHLDAGEWFRASQPVPHLAALSEAVWNATASASCNDRGEGATRRDLEPLGLVLKAGIWYVVASVDDQIRTYRVSRVVAAEPGEERFERPEGFDLASYWAESSAAYERDVPRVAVDVRVRPDRLEHLRDAVGSRAMSGAETLDGADPERLAPPDSGSTGR
jgi:predicted DNA-binding transcriptional regulator YafY